ncbi:MAG: MFS transporter [Rickettsia endosymbiont of Argas persicus]
MLLIKQISTDKTYLLGILLLSMISGFTFNLIFFTVPYQLSEAKYTTDIVGSISLAAFPYCFKIIWSPFIDKYSIPFLCSKFGARRGWAIASQISLILAMTIFLVFNPCHNIFITAITLFIISFCAATQDIVLDAYRIERPNSKQELSLAFTLGSMGFRLGMLLSSVGALYVSVILGWHIVYKLAILITFLAPIIILCIKEPKPRQPHHRTNELITLKQYFEVIKTSIISLKNDADKVRSYYTKISTEKSKKTIKLLEGHILTPKSPRTYKNIVTNFSSSSSILLIMLFVFLFKAADSIPMAMSSPLLLELGFTTNEIAFIYKAYGLFIMMVGGVLGGILSAKIGILRSVLTGGIIQLLSPLMFMILAIIGYDIKTFIITITMQNFCSGFAGTIISIYFASLCNSEFVATQYSIIASFSSVSRIILAALGGICAKYLTWSLFFFINTLFSMLFILTFLKVYGKRISK